jgi:hypothetical protein
MKDKLQEKHFYQWEAFDALSNIALDQIIDEEIAIRQQYSMDASLSEDAQNKLTHNRRAWMGEWGPRGRQVKALSNMQQHDRESAEMDDRYQIHLASEQEKAAQTDEETPLQKERNLRWLELETENVIIANEYQEELKKPLPAATQRRMEKNIAAFKAQYDGEQPLTPLEEWSTLDKEDFENHFQSWRDLMTSHNIVEYHYAVQGIEVPEVTKERQIDEVQDYQREMDTHAEEQKQDEIIIGKFREQLQSLRQKAKHPRPG